MDVLKYKRKFTFQNWEWNETSVDKIKELCQLVDMAMKFQQRMTEMPSKDTDVETSMERTWKDPQRT